MPPRLSIQKIFALSRTHSREVENEGEKEEDKEVGKEGVRKEVSDMEKEM